ncbi:hypothetical protein CYLTODRAFT_324315, partial [Cylindrobasidium torrendii FP15055 ss-10]
HVRAAFTNAQKLAEAAQTTKSKVPLQERIPPQYRAFIDVFNKKQSERLPEHRPWDHVNDLKPDFEPPK